MTAEIHNGIFANVKHRDGTDLSPVEKFGYSTSLALHIIKKSSVDVTNDNRRTSNRWRPDGSDVKRNKSDTVNDIKQFMIENKLTDRSPNYSGAHERVFDLIRDVKKEQRIATPSRDAAMLHGMLHPELQAKLLVSKNPNIVEDMVRAIADRAKDVSRKGFFARVGQNSRLKMEASSTVFQVLRENEMDPGAFTGFQGDITGLLTMMKQAQSLAGTGTAAVTR